MRVVVQMVVGWARAKAASAKAALSFGTGANTVTVTAKSAGAAGNDISLTIAGVAAVSDGAKSPGYSELGNDMTVQLATSAAVAAAVTKQDIVITAAVAGAAGNSIAPVFVGVAHAYDGAKSLALTDTANAPSVQMETSAAVARRWSCHIDRQPNPDGGFYVTAVIKGAVGSLTAVAGAAVEVDESAYPDIVLTYISGVTDGTDMVDYINANATKITAAEDWGGAGAIVSIDVITQVDAGADSAVLSTTAQVATCLNASSQVTATGGTGATATAESSFNLENGADSAISSTTAELQGIFSTSTLVTAAGGSTGAAAAMAHTHLDGGV